MAKPSRSDASTGGFPLSIDSLRSLISAARARQTQVKSGKPRNGAPLTPERPVLDIPRF